MTTEEKLFFAVQEISSLPFASSSVTTVPAAWVEQDASMEPCEEESSKFCAMPDAPRATTAPPVTVPVPSKSRAPLLLLSGPYTYTFPPVTVKLPSESNPSPAASITMYPPEIISSLLPLLCIKLRRVSSPLSPPAAFRPSSEAVASILPPEISMHCPSIPS